MRWSDSKSLSVATLLVKALDPLDDRIKRRKPLVKGGASFLLRDAYSAIWIGRKLCIESLPAGAGIHRQLDRLGGQFNPSNAFRRRKRRTAKIPLMRKE